MMSYLFTTLYHRYGRPMGLGAAQIVIFGVFFDGFQNRGHAGLSGDVIPHRQTSGLESNSLEEQTDTDRDSFQLLRQIVVTALAQGARTVSGPFFPGTPERRRGLPQSAFCVWATEVYAQRAVTLNHHRHHCDQCRLGQVPSSPKEHSALYHLPLHHWQGLTSNHGEHARPKTMRSDVCSK